MNIIDLQTNIFQSESLTAYVFSDLQKAPHLHVLTIHGYAVVFVWDTREIVQVQNMDIFKSDLRGTVLAYDMLIPLVDPNGILPKNELNDLSFLTLSSKLSDFDNWENAFRKMQFGDNTLLFLGNLHIGTIMLDTTLPTAVKLVINYANYVNFTMPNAKAITKLSISQSIKEAYELHKLPYYNVNEAFKALHVFFDETCSKFN